MSKTFKSPVLSVVMPAYNVEKFIRQAIDSVLKQSFQDFELILINDGSTDTTGAIMDSYLPDERITVIHQTNQGVSFSRKKGLEAAAGTYLYYMDSDDILKEGAFDYFYQQIRKDEYDIVGYSLMKFRDKSSTKKLSKYGCNPELPGPFSGQNLLVWLIKTGNYQPCLPQYFFKLDLLKKYDLKFDAGYIHEDDAFLIPALCLAEKVMTTSKVYYCHRRWSGSIMASNRGVNSIEGILHAIRKYREFLDQYESRLQNDTKAVIQKRVRELCHVIISLIQKLNHEQGKKLVPEDFLSKKEMEILNGEMRLRIHYPGLYNLMKKYKILKVMNMFSV